MEVNEIVDLMTPQEILDLTDFGRARPILPENFKTFDDLLSSRGAIRYLSLLPVKSNEMRAAYKAISKDQLEQEVNELLKDRSFVCATNKYPYVLPMGTKQYLIWVKDKNASREEIAKFIMHVVEVLNEQNQWNITPGTMILFERPLGIDKMLIQGTFSQVRHIHLWIKEGT